jgi:hypothetical protein
MKISPKAILYAIHSVLQKRAIKPGAALSLDLMKRDWKETRLRDGDLEKGLNVLERAGQVALETTPFGIEVRLISDGFGRVVTDDDRQAMADWAILRKLRGPAPSYAAATERQGTAKRSVSDVKKPG